MTDYSIHPACAHWPRPSDKEVQALAESIRTEGLLNAIWVMPDGAILDGKTRLEACGIAGVAPRFETYLGGSPEQFTVAQNRLRRHMPDGALALIVATLAKLPRGGNHGNQYTGGKVIAITLPKDEETMEALAETAGLARHTVVQAKALLEKAEPNIIDMVRKGEVGVVNAALFAKNTPREQQRTATAQTVKTRGAALRTPHKRPPVRTPKPLLNEKVVGIHVLIEELYPLFERVLEQSKRHIARLSTPELAMIAGDGMRLLDRWASDDPTVRRMRGHVVPPDHPAKRKDMAT